MSKEDCERIFKRVSTKLKSKDWFKSEKWKVSSHSFPEKKPEFQTFHIYKAHWYNNEKQGIHIESFLAFDEKKRKKSSITIHLLHYKTIPGTRIKRQELSKPVVDTVFEKVSTWDGYKFRTGKYGLQPFTKLLDGSSADFEKELIKEATRICKGIGPTVDKVLKTILKNEVP